MRVRISRLVPGVIVVLTTTDRWRGFVLSVLKPPGPIAHDFAVGYGGEHASRCGGDPIRTGDL